MQSPGLTLDGTAGSRIILIEGRAAKGRDVGASLENRTAGLCPVSGKPTVNRAESAHRVDAASVHSGQVALNPRSDQLEIAGREDRSAGAPDGLSVGIHGIAIRPVLAHLTKF